MLACLVGAGADAALLAFTTRLAAAGVPVAGALTLEGGRIMRLRLLPCGSEVVISQNLGPGAGGCRLDAGALEAVVARVDAQRAGAGLLVINRFGRSEAEGRGFRALIGAAVMDEIPVLAVTSPAYLPAFHEFAGGMAQVLPADGTALDAWWLGVSNRA